jgi:hypothetical protein
MLSEQVVSALRNAGFEIELEVAAGRRRLDVVTTRDVLGRKFRYAIELRKTGLVEKELEYALRSFKVYNQHSPDEPLDELWIVVESLTVRPDKGFNNPKLRVLSFIEFIKFIGTFAAELRGKKARRSTKTPRTKVGKAVHSNAKEIQLAIAALILQIDAKLEGLRNYLANDPDSQTKRDTEIIELEKMKAELERIRQMVADFAKKQAPEKEVVKAVTSFSDGVHQWWNKKHTDICSDTYNLALFTGAVMVCSLAGAGGNIGVAVAAAVTGGKPVIDAIKAIAKKILPGS